uniref:DUF512 domain-containing protein n=1 Tax=candidate division WOR-3 bacterium TaxID=2052148 RepID=A0A7C4UHK1_UNCW3
MLKVVSVEKDSVAEKAGVLKDDLIIRINKNKINDLIDYNYSIAEEEILIELKREKKNMEIMIRRREGETLGINVEPLKIRRCSNNCSFCFMDQLPPDARPSLFVKDDDYRASFLYGNFISLSNMTENDYKRIKKMHLSPIYVSVHTTNPSLRAEIMGNERCARIKEDIERLIKCNVKIHTQIVLIPDVNDRDEYISTIEDLSLYFPDIISIGVVPVGLTTYRYNLKPIKKPTREWAEEVIKMSEPFQREFREKFGINFLYLADEFYIIADYDIPETEYYDDFPQIENGIGMVRRFLDELEDVEIPDFSGRTILVTGVLASKFILKLEDKFRENGLKAQTVVIKNRYFGETVTVSGLLGGWDIAGMLYNYDGENVILPPDVLNDDNLFIDSMPLERFKEIVKKRVYIAPRELSKFKNIVQ